MALSKEARAAIDHLYFDILRPNSVYWATDAIKRVEAHLNSAGVGIANPTERHDGRAYFLEIANERLTELEKEVERQNALRLSTAQAERRLLDGKPVQHDLLYRKMSRGEWDAIFADWGDEPSDKPYRRGEKNKKIRLGAALTYVNTKFYRVWFTTSLAMCRRFFNLNATKDGDIIVRFGFDSAPKDAFAKAMLPQKMSGVQHNASVVAWHRENFLGRIISKVEQMQAVLDAPSPGGDWTPRHYNLGFTSEHKDWLESNCRSAQIMNARDL